MTSVAPAKNGAFMHIPTNTPRVHGLTTPLTHARRRAGHPLAGGRLGKQNAVRTILGRLVSSSVLAQEHESGSEVRSSFRQHGRYFVKNGNDPDAKSERLRLYSVGHYPNTALFLLK